MIFSAACFCFPNALKRLSYPFSPSYIYLSIYLYYSLSLTIYLSLSISFYRLYLQEGTFLTMILLPEMWMLIADFASWPALACVSRELGCILTGRHNRWVHLIL